MKQSLNILLAVATSVAINTALAADVPIDELRRHVEHQHSNMQADASLTLAAALQTALERYPSAVELEARVNEAGAWKKRGRSWIAGSPALSLR